MLANQTSDTIIEDMIGNVFKECLLISEAYLTTHVAASFDSYRAVILHCLKSWFLETIWRHEIKKEEVTDLLDKSCKI